MIGMNQLRFASAQPRVAQPHRKTPNMRRVLFVCSRNKLRSPTAEQIFSSHPGLEVASAGLNDDSATPVSAELLEWADVIFVMEKIHRSKLSRRYGKHLKKQRIICLDIPDKFEYMDNGLVRLLKATVPRHLGLDVSASV
jgi:predicted protein tyrosine phosphatase